MANSRAVEEVSTSGKTRKKTNVFWSTVPENEQFRNVQVPGVALDRFKKTKKDIQAQKYAKVVEKSKSDSAILNTRTDLSTVNKQGKVGHKLAAKKNDLSGGASSDQLSNMSTLSESTRRASLKNLNVEDKKRVANLIKELAKTGEERELALERLQEERVCFDEQLGAVHEEQTALKQEREILKQRLEKSEKLLKQYESDLKIARSEKAEQDKILKKKFQAQPQSTQTSPLIQNLGPDDAAKSWRVKIAGEQDGIEACGAKKTSSTQAHIAHGESNDRDSRRKWSTPQVPVYSNSLFDVKVSNVEHENSEARSTSDEYQGTRVIETGSVHELYLREYSLQLRLQEQQIEIQRQQVQLQQQLQLLQQQQQQQQQQQLQQGLHQPLEYKEKYSNEGHKHQQQKLTKHHVKEYQPQPLDQKRQNKPQKWHQQQPEGKNENILKQASPTQQTNLLRKRTPEPKDHQSDIQHQEDTVKVHENAGRLLRKRHDHRKHMMVHSRHEHEAELHGQHYEQQTTDRSYKPSSSPSHHRNHQFEGTTEENINNRNKGQHGLNSGYYKSHHMTKGKSPKTYHRNNDAKQIDFNNNYQPRSRGLEQRRNRYDINVNLGQDYSPQEYFSESYGDADEQQEEECYDSESHCGQYHKHSRHHTTSECAQCTSNHSHSNGMPQYGYKQKSPRSPVEIQHQKSKPIPTQVYLQPNMHHDSPNRTDTYHQRLTYDTQRRQGPQKSPPLKHHRLHKGEYDHHPVPDIHEKDNGVPRYGEHVGGPAYGAAYPPSNKHHPIERRVSRQHQSGSMLPPQVRTTQHRHQSSDGLRRSRPQMSKDTSQDLLDDYIYHHQTSGEYNAKSNSESNEHSTKRNMSRKGNGIAQVEADAFLVKQLDRHRAMSYTTSNQHIQYEDDNPDPGYSLYKPNTPQPTIEQRKHPRTSPPGPSHRQYSRTRYPNSLVEIVENLEVNSGYEERYSDDNGVYSSEQPDYDSDEEESSVLDNIFFLKR